MNENERMQMLFEVFVPSLPRLGPGDDESTIKALETLYAAGLPGDRPLNILELGCGNGAPTMALAEKTRGAILALDFHQPFLDELMRRAKARGFEERIRPYLKDMNEPDLEQESFDLIWSEGALGGSMGVQKGLPVCRSLLAPGGMMAFTELVYFTDEAPRECREFFGAEYPPMTDVKTNLAYIEEAGFELLGHFSLDPKAWLDNFYDPMEKRLVEVMEKYAGNPAKMELLAPFRQEVDNYREHGKHFGYEFFMMKK